MRWFRALVFVPVLVLLGPSSLVARADTFTVSALAPNTGSLSFSLDPSTPYTTPGGLEYFEYDNLYGSIDGAPVSFDYVEFYDTAGVESLFVGDDFDDLYVTLTFPEQFLTGAADGSAPTIVPGTYLGQLQCDATLRSPFAASQLPGTMAFLQLQSPITTECGEDLQLAISGTGTTPPPPPSSVTPEPSSLALFGTGVLGVAGLLRRRMRA